MGAMTIQVACRCGNTLQVDEGLAGSQVECPLCARQISVPRGAGAEPPEEPLALRCECGVTLRVSAQRAGRGVECPSCRRQVRAAERAPVVPKAVVPKPVPPPQANEPKPVEPKPVEPKPVAPRAVTPKSAAPPLVIPAAAPKSAAGPPSASTPPAVTPRVVEGTPVARRQESISNSSAPVGDEDELPLLSVAPATPAPLTIPRAATPEPVLTLPAAPQLQPAAPRPAAPQPPPPQLQVATPQMQPSPAGLGPQAASAMLTPLGPAPQVSLPAPTPTRLVLPEAPASGNGRLVAVIGGGLALIAILVVGVLWLGGRDDDTIVADGGTEMTETAAEETRSTSTSPTTATPILKQGADAAGEAATTPYASIGSPAFGGAGSMTPSPGIAPSTTPGPAGTASAGSAPAGTAPAGSGSASSGGLDSILAPTPPPPTTPTVPTTPPAPTPAGGAQDSSPRSDPPSRPPSGSGLIGGRNSNTRASDSDDSSTSSTANSTSRGPGEMDPTLASATRRWIEADRASGPPLVRGLVRAGDDPNIVIHFSWMTQLLPYLGHDQVYGQFNFRQDLFEEPNLNVASTIIPQFLDPRDPRKTWRSDIPLALTHFVGMSGVEDSRNVVAATLPRSDPRAGVFGYDEVARPEQITDGQSNTLLLVGAGELAAPWAQGGGATIRGARGRRPLDPSLGFATRGSAGAVVSFADGSVRTLSSDMDPAVFRAMCTTHGAESVDLRPYVGE